MEPVPQEVRSLLVLSARAIVFSQDLLQCVLQSGLPSSIHSLLFTVAAEIFPWYPECLRCSVMDLVSSWPTATFKITDLLTGMEALDALLARGETAATLLDAVLEGLLTLKAHSKLKCVDFADVHAPGLFRLPVLSLPPEKRVSDVILQAVKAKYNEHTNGGLDNRESDDNMESVLTWKLGEMAKERKYDLQLKGPIEVLTECQLNLTDWIAMDDEMLGLLVQEMTPFKLKITKLVVDNFHLRQGRHLKWLLSIIDPQVLSSLVFYGKRKSMSQLIWEFQEHLKQLCNLTMFGMGTSGPRMLYDKDKPTMEEMCLRSAEVFHTWTNLRGVYFIGPMLTGQIETLFSALPSPLEKVNLVGCSLSRSDIAYLAGSHHVSSIVELGLEKNNFQGMKEELCVLLAGTVNLEILGLKETQLQLHEKLCILTALQNSTKLETLAMFENEDMVSVDGYNTMVHLACSINSLKKFYVFPFDYKPFEMFYRATVETSTREILVERGRTDMTLYY